MPWLKRHLRIVLTLAIGLAILPSYLRAFKLSTASAAPTINIGDTFLVNRADSRIYRLLGKVVITFHRKRRGAPPFGCRIGTRADAVSLVSKIARRPTYC